MYTNTDPRLTPQYGSRMKQYIRDNWFQFETDFKNQNAVYRKVNPDKLETILTDRYYYNNEAARIDNPWKNVSKKMATSIAEHMTEEPGYNKLYDALLLINFYGKTNVQTFSPTEIKQRQHAFFGLLQAGNHFLRDDKVKIEKSQLAYQKTR